MNRIILISPLGWERERATKIAFQLNIHKFYLLFRNVSQHHSRFKELVKNDIEENKIEIELIEVNEKYPYESLLFEISRIIVTESQYGNIVYVNMSSGNKLEASAASMSVMYHHEKIRNLIYIHPKEYTVFSEDPKVIFNQQGMTTGIDRIYYPPIFQIEKPKRLELNVIMLLYKHHRLTYMEILSLLRDMQVKPFDQYVTPSNTRLTRKREISKWTAKLKRLALNGLEGNYLEIKPSYNGREKIVELTTNGINLALISGEASDFEFASTYLEKNY